MTAAAPNPSRANDQAKDVGDSLTLCSELSRLHDRFTAVAKRVQEQADAR